MMALGEKRGSMGPQCRKHVLMGVCGTIIVQDHLKGGAPREWSPYTFKRLNMFDLATMFDLVLVVFVLMLVGKGARRR